MLLLDDDSFVYSPSKIVHWRRHIQVYIWVSNTTIHFVMVGVVMEQRNMVTIATLWILTSGLCCKLNPTNVLKSMVLRWNGTYLCMHRHSIEFVRVSLSVCPTLYSAIVHVEDFHGWVHTCTLDSLWFSVQLDPVDLPGDLYGLTGVCLVFFKQFYCVLETWL